jgi:hypothetical protein
MVRRYRVVGGLVAWRIPVLTAGLLLGVGAEGGAAAVGVALSGAALAWLEGSVVIEVSAAGLSRGLQVGGCFVGLSRVLPWHAVGEIETEWLNPRGTTALVTHVRGAGGLSIRFTTRMGLAAYRQLLAVAVGHARGARLTGLTEALVAEAGAPELSAVLTDRALLVVAGVLVAWAVALPWIFGRY